MTEPVGRTRIELLTSADGQHYLAHAFPLMRERSLQCDGAATVLFLQKASMVPQLQQKRSPQLSG